MKGRLIFAIISTLLEEAALLVIVLWGLPRLGIRLPLPGLVILMLLWAALAVFTYRASSEAFRKGPLITLPDMVGGRGTVVSPLVPAGLVKIGGELWIAKSTGKQIEVGVKVTVVAQEGLKLVVRETRADSLAEVE